MKEKQEFVQEIKVVHLKSWVYVTFIKKNLFVNIYNEIDGKKLAVQFMSLSTFIPLSDLKSKIDPIRVEFFALHVGKFLKIWDAQELIVVFHGTGAKLGIKHLDPIRDAEKKRVLFINALEKNEVKISSLIDLSPISFNGCKNSKKRRGRDDARRITI